jgi:hypothetical protein
VDTKCIKKKEKEVKRKIEIAETTRRINQTHPENSVGNIVVSDSYNYKDTNARYYVSIDIGKRTV